MSISLDTMVAKENETGAWHLCNCNWLFSLNSDRFKEQQRFYLVAL